MKKGNKNNKILKTTKNRYTEKILCQNEKKYKKNF